MMYLYILTSILIYTVSGAEMSSLSVLLPITGTPPYSILFYSSFFSCPFFYIKSKNIMQKYTSCFNLPANCLYCTK